MGWHVERVVRTKEKAKEIVEAQQYIPAELKAAIVAWIDALAMQPNCLIHLKTDGHLDTVGGNADFSLRQILLAE